ncbi:MAG: hypothetical protein ISR79_00365 [Nitrosopumilus sp.]|nr:hypothetical protein [Nitrosopumilus sp.]
MNRKEWLGKFEYNHILLNTMIEAIPNFEKHDDTYVIRKSLKYYATLDRISLMVLKNRTMPEMRTITCGIENKITIAKELLAKELERKNILNEWGSKLPDIERKY